MPKKISLTDIVINSSTMDRLVMEGWLFDHNIVTGTFIFIKILYANPETEEVFENHSKNSNEIIIRLETNAIFRAKSMTFGWKTGSMEVIPEKSRLGKILSSYLLMTFERFGYHSFENDIEKRTLSDYPLAMDYIAKRCEEIYHVEPPNTEIYIVPKKMWAAFHFDKAVEAEYNMKEKFIAIPERKWKSKNYESSLIIHEIIHSIQQKKGWIVDIQDLGLTRSDISKIAEGVVFGRSLDLVAMEVGKDPSLIKRAKGLLDQRFEYMSKYFEIPNEVNAFAEQFRFLTFDRGIPKEKILESLLARSSEKGGSMNSRDKELFSGMIYESDQKIMDSIHKQEVLANEHIPETSGIETDHSRPDS